MVDHAFSSTNRLGSQVTGHLQEKNRGGVAWEAPTYSFGRGASKSTTQGGIFDLIMYITFDCAEIAGLRHLRRRRVLPAPSRCASRETPR